MATLSLQHIDKIYDNNVQAVYDFNMEHLLEVDDPLSLVDIKLLEL